MLKRLENGEIYFGNAKWTTPDTILCLVQIEGTGEVIDFNATPYDEEDYGRELFEMLSTKYAGLVTPCPEEEKYEDAANWVRHDRGILLKECDWITNGDVLLENQAEWLQYRQSLRDVTNQSGFPYDVKFPAKPTMTKNTYNVVIS